MLVPKLTVTVVAVILKEHEILVCECECEWVSEWVSECVSVCVCEWVSEWVSECVSVCEWVSECDWLTMRKQAASMVAFIFTSKSMGTVGSEMTEWIESLYIQTILLSHIGFQSCQHQWSTPWPDPTTAWWSCPPLECHQQKGSTCIHTINSVSCRNKDRNTKSADLTTTCNIDVIILVLYYI